MSNCKCKSRKRIVSNIAMGCTNNYCRDVCVNPICGDPKLLGIYAPVIYDEVGINLCTTFTPEITISSIAGVNNATVQIISIDFADGPTGITITPIQGRPNCYRVTMTQLTANLALNLYDSTCRLLTTTYSTATFLPTSDDDPSYDSDTNPTSVELEIFAPYGLTYTGTGAATTPVMNYIGFTQGENTVTQGLNMYGIGKVLDLDIPSNTVTLGLTLVVQSLYYSGYKVASEGRIEIPKGCITNCNDSECIRFVAGDLLDLNIKPLDLGRPFYEEDMKQQCSNPSADTCSSCNSYNNIPELPSEPVMTDSLELR